jgi:peroxiredoxin
MAQLRHDYQEFVKRDTEVVIVGPDGVDEFKSYWKEQDLPFIGLPNPSHSVLKAFGQEINLFKMGRMPAQALIDKNGVVRFVHYGHSMSDIPEDSEILGLIDELNKEYAVLPG